MSASVCPLFTSQQLLTASFLSVGLVYIWIYEVARAGMSWWPKQIRSLKVHFLLCLPYLFTINYKDHYLQCMPVPGVVAGSQLTMGMEPSWCPSWMETANHCILLSEQGCSKFLSKVLWTRRMITLPSSIFLDSLHLWEVFSRSPHEVTWDGPLLIVL